MHGPKTQNSKLQTNQRMLRTTFLVAIRAETKCTDRPCQSCKKCLDSDNTNHPITCRDNYYHKTHNANCKSESFAHPTTRRYFPFRFIEHCTSSGVT